jgi:hypothetical protein
MQNYCGLDVHKDSVFMCILNESGVLKECQFKSLTSALYELRDELLSYNVYQVAMESTSIYWISVWRVLVKGFNLKLANPFFIKQLPGRKSDIRDAHWIGLVLMKGLVSGSYVPDQKVCVNTSIVIPILNKRIIHVEQCIDMQLQRCNIRFSNYISGIGSQAMRKVVKKIIGWWCKKYAAIRFWQSG